MYKSPELLIVGSLSESNISDCGLFFVIKKVLKGGETN